MSKPITPSEVASRKAQILPAFVLDAFNEVIAKHWNGRSSTFEQDEVVAELLAKDLTATRDDVFNNHWLDVEPCYREAGWTVSYDRPGFNESYSATFTFRRKD